ncbi:MAG: hypothetical protein ABI594_03750 [Ginsengibacter sp.]
MRILIIFFGGLMTLFSCSAPSKIIKYDEHKNEFYTNSNLQDLLVANKFPKVVLRVGKFNFRSLTDNSSQKTMDYLYNAMENELIKQGFNVKDRSTFNEFVSRTNSAELLKKELSDVDLVLEVVSIDDNVQYSTNKVISLKRKDLTQAEDTRQYKSVGAYVEYHLIIVKNNEIGGTYKFYYEPCPHGCPIENFKSINKGKKDNQLQLSKGLSKEIMEQFISSSVQELVYSLRSTDQQK